MTGLFSKVILIGAGVSGAALTAQTMVQPLPSSVPQARQTWPPRGLDQVQPTQPSSQTVQPLPQQVSDPLVTTIDEWKRLQQSDRWPFFDYANFLLAHPGWPGEAGRRQAAEAVLDSGASAPALVIRFFQRFPPVSGAGRTRFAEALEVSGRRGEAQEQARLAWRGGVLRTTDEAKLITGFPGAIGPADHDARMDALLWAGSTSSAQRQLALVSPGRRALFAARLAFRTGAADAGSLDAAVSPADRDDAGYIADRAQWLRSGGSSPAARAYLAQSRRTLTAPSDVEAWYEVLLTNARAAAADRQYQLAYDIARQIDDAYPPGTDVSTRPYGERDDYTSLAWLAGQTARRSLGRARDAASLYARYAGGSRTPQTQSKGYYWAGRAAESAGDSTAAQGYYAQAAQWPDLYYGQLAAERMGRPIPRVAQTAPAAIDPAIRDAFFRREVVRAVRLLGQLGRTADQTLFVRQIANDAKSAPDHALAAELASQVNRPDLRVMVGRSASLNGHAALVSTGYPVLPTTGAASANFTMVHAITRQESQFDRNAVSRAGARGLMQLMPGTAREQSGKLGLGYNLAGLTGDPGYNVQLGSAYIQRMLDYYGGSYPLAVAAYNAGPGNVNKWLAANGDPRRGVDIVEWVEDIPISETRNYVQRVLENAVVYDLLYPDRARSRGPANLSFYLGKSRPG
ncbi:lytic transglycosylase domain-containing protein [Sphingomonas sp. Y38-1Y]|uniref:lytic transglycosylase domain-containing protein n=1 Tax=Sphingomonas sp. Y38-1Y TaxID=3078265 RepID=UPI0028E782F7|nr:lytic transglycosylase domain-containing protein [Sphingomonas sp. Y38-1Y]